MKKLSVFCFAMLLCIGILAGCLSEKTPTSSNRASSETSLLSSELPQSLEKSDSASEETPNKSDNPSSVAPTIYITTNISAEGLMGEQIKTWISGLEI